MKTETVLLLTGVLCIFFSTFFGWFYFWDMMEEHRILRTCGLFIPFMIGMVLVSWDIEKKKMLQDDKTMKAILAIDVMSYVLSGIIMYYLNV